MSLLQALALSGAPAEPLYSDSVFSAYTYTGTGASQTITNGIDLAGKGGLVWIKERSPTGRAHNLFDTVRGATKVLESQATMAEYTATTTLTAFNSNGFTLGADATYGSVNYSASDTYVAWTFRKAAKFFDVVTYTGNGTTQTFNHSLGVTPGIVIVKSTSGAGNWNVFHRAATGLLKLNLTDAESGAISTYFSSVTSTSVSVTDSAPGMNNNGTTYVAYLFAHDTTTDGIIQCGSFTTDGSGNATVSLGWEPQYLLIKQTNSTRNWEVVDTMRGPAAPYYNPLSPNTAGTEATSGAFTANAIDATGFKVSDVVSATYIYMAIRRPNKPPTLGTQVYNAIARTGTGAAATVTGVGFAPDLVVSKHRSIAWSGGWFNRLCGAAQVLCSSNTIAEATATNSVVSFDMDGYTLGADSGDYINSNTRTEANWLFRRAPGVFDQVCYTGTGVAKTEAHNLGVVPELWIVKGRSGATAWRVGCTALANTDYLVLNTTAVVATDATSWNSTYPTTSVFSIGAQADVNTSSATYVAYLFATKAGISKVGSYTGNGSSQTINCGFTTGARFVLIKRTDSTGDWFVWDSVRGIVAGNDPHLSLNTTAAEVTTDDSIDPDTSGFIVNQDAATNINVNAASYIYLSFA